METYIFLGIVGLLRLMTGIVLWRLAAQQKLPNLRWLAAGFLITVIDVPFTAQPYIPYVDKTLTYIVYLCFALFIASTFYKDRRSPLLPFWALFTLLYIGMFFTTSRFMTEAVGVGFPGHLFMARPPYADVPMTASETLDSLIYGTLQLAIWLWHALAGYQASRSVRDDEHVEDWIKSRYRMIVTYSVLQSLVGVFMMIRAFISPTLVMISALLVMVTTVMQYLVWVMPEGFRRWLNRHQQTRTEEKIREQAHAILNILGTAMAEAGISKMVAVFSLRKVIGAEVQSEDTLRVDARAINMGFNEWSALLESPQLFDLIKNSGLNINTTEVLANAKKALIQKQSLFTMKAK